MNIHNGDKSQEQLVSGMETNFQCHAAGNKTLKDVVGHKFNSTVPKSLFYVNTNVFITVRVMTTVQ